MDNSVFELAYEPQLLTQGLLTGQPLVIRINCAVICNGMLCYLPWKWRIECKLNGQECYYTTTSIGSRAERDDLELTFHGIMPAHDLSGELLFSPAGAPPWDEEYAFGKVSINVPNLSDVPPDGDGGNGAVHCNEGEWYCEGTTLVICEKVGNVCDWHKYPYHSWCKGQEPPDGDGNGDGAPPNGGDGMDWQAWIEKYKWVIIGVSVAVIALAIFLIRRK